MLFFLLLTSNALLAALKCKTLYRYQLNLLCNDLEQKQHLYTDINYVFSVSFAQTFKDALNGKCRCCIKLLFSWELRGHKPNTVRLNNQIFTCPCTQTETTWCILLDSSIYCGRQRYTHIYAHTHTDTSWYRLICTLHRASFLRMCVSVLLENLWPACISLVVLSALNLS